MDADDDIPTGVDHPTSPLGDAATIVVGTRGHAPRSDSELRNAVVGRSAPRRYDLREVLGAGGMGEVYLAVDERIGRGVALKVLHESLRENEELLARFRQEAQLQGRLEHPGIVPVYDVDRDDQGRAFFVMKRVVGVTFEAIVQGLERGEPGLTEKYSLRRLLSAFLTACLTVDYAHSRGVVHRDLKLSNLMLGDFGEVYVLDWGIAKVSTERAPTSSGDPTESHPTTDTRHDTVLGTPGYMAPEQLADSAAVDGRADIYALGVILFALLTRDQLHVATPRAEIARSTLVGAEARPSVRAPHLDIPPEFDLICVKATAIDPNHRYQTARELHDAVQGVLDGDRDARLRIDLSERHLSAARRALDTAHGESGGLTESGRREALRQAGRALALHPRSEQAAEFVASLMLTPPTRVPAEVELETRAISRREFSRATTTGTAGAVVLIALLGVAHWVGVRSWSAIAMITAPLLLGYVTNVMPNRVAAVVLSSALISVTIGATSRIAGPLWFPPLFGVSYVAIVTSIHGLGRWRAVCVGMVFAGVLIPWLLEVGGVTPQQYVADGSFLHVGTDAVWWHPQRAELALGAACLAVMLMTAMVMWHFSAGDLESRRQLQLVAWHLRQLAPQGDSGRPSSPAHVPLDAASSPATPADEEAPAAR